jgi:hypothetical protein
LKEPENIQRSPFETKGKQYTTNYTINRITKKIVWDYFNLIFFECLLFNVFK